jgi:hypothetical protein
MKRNMNFILIGLILVSIFFIYLGFHEFNSGGIFLNLKIIIASLIIISLVIFRIFYNSNKII